MQQPGGGVATPTQAARCRHSYARTSVWAAAKVSLCACTAAAAMVCSPPSVSASVTANVHADAAAEHRWQPCRSGTPCVSSNSFMQPAQYLPPWLYNPATPDAAFKALLDELSTRSATVLETDQPAGFIAAQVPFGPGPSDYDLLQLLLKPDGVVLFRSEAAAGKLYPPFCFQPGCISGPANRQRLEALRDDLGWSVLEPDEDKQWVQILLH